MPPAQKGTRGRSPWVQGSKYTRFVAARSKWEAAKLKGHSSTGLFYSNFTKYLIATYGWHFDLENSDKECPEPTTEAWTNIQDTAGLDQDEIDRRKPYYGWLRPVSDSLRACMMHVLKRLPAESAPVVPTKEDAKRTDMEVKTTLARIAKSLPKPPRRTRMTQFYGRHWFRERHNTDYGTLVKAEQERVLAPGEKRLSPLDIINKVAIQYYEKEPKEFKEWLTAEREKAFQEKVRVYKEKMKALDVAPVDAEGYHRALSNAAAFMQPLCDLTAKKFGGAVAMLVVLPVQTGSVEMRSVFSGKTNELIPRNFPEFDPAGFDALQESYVNFGQHVYSQADCNVRVLKSQTAEEVTKGLGEEDEEDDDEDEEVEMSFLDDSSPLHPSPLAVSMPSPHAPSTFSFVPTPASGPVCLPGPTPSPSVLPVPTPSTEPTLLFTPAPSEASRPPVLMPAPQAALPSPALTPPLETAPMIQRTPTPPRTSAAAPPSPAPTSSLEPAPVVQPLPSLSPTPEATPAPTELAAAVLAAVGIDDIPPTSTASFAGVLEVADRWGTEWAQLVAAFINFERDAGFSTQELRLPSSDLRPLLIKTWFGFKRVVKGDQWEELGTGDGAAFGASWWAWWTDIQPGGRQVEGDTIYGADGSLLDWKRLCKPGPTGIFLVLITLVWWRKMLGAEDDSSWRIAVRDVRNVLERSRQPVPTAAVTKKRKPSAADTVKASDAPLRKKRATVPTSRLLGIAP
ncbi:hypothetical protein HWV62_13241 [Athelia sp. TMB]|nr:hypothetical protein HWV62_13241 [Athelia sp. TMB]